jgi:hypothetical protein
MVPVTMLKAVAFVKIPLNQRLILNGNNMLIIQKIAHMRIHTNKALGS